MSANLSDSASYVKGSHLQSWMTNICTVFGIILPLGWILILSAGQPLGYKSDKKALFKKAPVGVVLRTALTGALKKKHQLLKQLLKLQTSHNFRVVGLE